MLLALVHMGIKCGASREVTINSIVCKILVWLSINNRLVLGSTHTFLEHIVYLIAKEHPLLVLVVVKLVAVWLATTWGWNTPPLGVGTHPHQFIAQELCTYDHCRHHPLP